MRVPRFAVVVVVAAGVLASSAAVSSAAVAASPAAAVQAKSKAKPAKTAKPGKATKPAKPVTPRPVPFTAVGTVTAVDVDASTLAVAVAGGTRDVRGKAMTFQVAPASRVRVNDAPGTVADVQIGAQVTVTGTRSDAGYTVVRVIATNPAPTPEPTPTPTPEPTPEPEQ